MPVRREAPMTAIECQVKELEGRVLEFPPDLGRTATLAEEILRLKRASEALAQRAAQLQAQKLDQSLFRLKDDLEILRRDLCAAAQARPLDEPPFIDMRWATPVAPDGRWATRSLRNVEQIVIEHTSTLGDVTPGLLARIHIEQGKPAVACHYLVGQDGTIYWTQPLESAVGHTLRPDVNLHSIAVSLAGSFNGQPPAPIHLEATADLLSWLVTLFGLELAHIRGRRELEDVPSPGAQWSTGANYKQVLLELVRGRLQGQAQSSRTRPLMAASPGPTAPIPAATVDGRVPRPNITDVVSSLPKHPTLPAYPARLKPVSVIAIHHTDSLKTVTVQQIAQYHVYGVRKNADGEVVKAEWPGIGYHFVIAADGTIYQCQREQTRSYHVGGSANEFCLGVSFIGRFMRTGFDGKPQAAADQIPTDAQLRSGGQLIAWLMQELNVPIAKVMGHRNVVTGTVCPGEHWESGLKWRGLLQKEIQSAIEAAQAREGDQPLEHYLLFWDHGTTWAAADWNNAQNYIAHFRPTVGFSVQDALQARHVTVVGGPAGVSPADEARLRSAGVQVQRLSGANEAETKAMLDALVARDTLWPGAPPNARDVVIEAEPLDLKASRDAKTDEFEYDEWTVPDDWERLLAPADPPEASLQREPEASPSEGGTADEHLDSQPGRAA
jgi:N-acetyl-anhydromuramyl-L-alanine amidase AmpD